MVSSTYHVADMLELCSQSPSLAL